MFRAVYKKSIGGLLAVCLSLSISSRAQKSASNFPAFIQNKGQILDQNNQQNKEVLFLYCGKGIKIQLRKSGYSYELFKVQDLPHSNPGQKIQDIQELLKTKISNCRADIDFIGGNPAAEIIAEQQSEGSCNYFTGGKRISDVHSFRKVTYKNIFPNTDIEFIITDDQGAPFKYNIILKPGADIKKVKFLIQGASEITTKRGDLSVSLPMGKIHESIPASYYIDQPAEKEQISFALQNNIVSFTGSYDHSRTFIIDPSTNRVWATYYGGSSLDYCTATGADGMNNAYITGYTLSTSTIATAGTYQSTLSGSFDIYLAKFNSGGVRLWASYFGGSSVEAVYGMFVAPSGTAYLCGDTFSTSNVASAGAHQTVYGGGVDDALLVKFDPSGQLLWSTYYGGLYHDIAVGVVEDSNGNVIISGHTESSTNIATAGSYKTLYYGGFDVFVAKFDSTGIRQWGTYYGELDVEETYAADCDAANNIYITGFTTSSNDIATASGYQTSYSGQQDAFIAKFNPSGTTLLYGTYYGGAGNDQGSAIKVDAFGNVFMTGNTTSLTGISSPGSYQPAIGSADDAFIVRFNSVGIRQWGTYFGGNDVDYIASMIFDSNENLLFCGSTLSTNAISSDQAYQPSLSGINYYDSYFERFDINGTRKHGTYLGGSSNDHGRGIAIDNSGRIYIGGETSSVDSIASPGAFNASWAGGDDAFLAKFCIASEPQLFPSGSTTICYGDTLWFSAPAGYASYLWNDSTTANSLATASTDSAGTYYYWLTVTNSDGCSSTTDSAVLIIDPCTSILEPNTFPPDVFPVPASDVFPVPASDILFLRMGENDYQAAEIEIYSSRGELMMKETSFEKNTSLDIKKLSPGMYILQVRVNEKLFRKKIIKQ